MPTIPIPIYTGHSSPMTEQQLKVVIGCVIVLYVIWVLTTIFTIIGYQLYKNDIIKEFGACHEVYLIKFKEHYFNGDSFLFGGFHIFMTALSAIGILIWLGTQVAKYL